MDCFYLLRYYELRAVVSVTNCYYCCERLRIVTGVTVVISVPKKIDFGVFFILAEARAFCGTVPQKHTLPITGVIKFLSPLGLFFLS